MDSLYSPWRMQYILDSQDDGDDTCVFCEVIKTEDDRKHLILHRDEYCYVILNLFPYNTGHLLVVPYRHVRCMNDLEAGEKAQSMELLVRAESVLRETFKPQGFNVGANIGSVAGAGIPGHLHFHILPRWEGDTNFLPVLGGTKSLPETLEESYDRLKSAWDA